jgi:hypothetical protein
VPGLLRRLVLRTLCLRVWEAKTRPRTLADRPMTALRVVTSWSAIWLADRPLACSRMSSLSLSRVQGALIQTGLGCRSVFGASCALFLTVLVSIALPHLLDLRGHEVRQVVYDIIESPVM